MSSDKSKAIVEYIENAFNEYTGSTVYTNWKILCDNIVDASEQKYRPGEQLTRQGMYYGVMRAQRDGWRESAIEMLGQARPLFTYKPRRGVSKDLSGRAQEEIADIWQDIDGLQKACHLWNDCVDYSMGVAYTKYCRYSATAEVPRIRTEIWGEMLDWEDDQEMVMDSPDFIRIHPYNYRCSMRGGSNPAWEGCEWEWSITDLYSMLSDDDGNSAAIRRIIDKMAKGEIGTDSSKFYSFGKERLGQQAGLNRTVYAKEYWGPLNAVEGMQRDASQYMVVVCEGEIIKKRVNKLRIGRDIWRPIKRIRLDPMNDIPHGAHVLAATLSHQRMKNLMMNLAADDIVIRQHLGLAVWRGSLENPERLLNPEGAREPLFMRHDAPVDRIPRFFADQSSGVVRDAMQFDVSVTEKDQQVNGLPLQALGYGGGSQGKTATEQTLLANSSSRKIRASMINYIDTGLKPICKDMLGLLLRNKPPQDLGMSPQDLAQVFANNFWEFDTSLTANLPAQASALAQWGSMAMQQMAAITPKDNPGSADHIVRLLKDSGKALGISTVSLDAYLPEGMPPQIQTQPQQAPDGMPPEMNPEAMNAMA